MNRRAHAGFVLPTNQHRAAVDDVADDWSVDPNDAPALNCRPIRLAAAEGAFDDRKTSTKQRKTVFKKISVKLKLPRVNDTPKIHLHSLGSVNFIDDWQVHEIFVKLSL